MGNPVEALGCPAMASSAGWDAMREMFTVTGVLGDNNAANGKQGNHEGESKVHDGVFDDSTSGKKLEHTFPLCLLLGKCGKEPGDKEHGDKEHSAKDDEDDDDDYAFSSKGAEEEEEDSGA